MHFHKLQAKWKFSTPLSPPLKSMAPRPATAIFMFTKTVLRVSHDNTHVQYGKKTSRNHFTLCIQENTTIGISREYNS